MTYEGLRLKILKYTRRKLAPLRGKQLKGTDFTIISNNCWGGMVYESYDLPKNSPTVGLFFMADDFIRFCTDIDRYLSEELTFITPGESRYKAELSNSSRFGSFPIGKLGDIELFFLHYHSEEEAADKWTRRCKRVNRSKLIFKFNDQNGCTIEHIRAFAALPVEHKLFFTVKRWDVPRWNGYVKALQLTRDETITASHEPFGKTSALDLTAYINAMYE